MAEVVIKRSKKINQFLKANRKKRFIFVWGGASSGKSHGLAQHIIERWQIEKGVNFLVLRKTRPAVKTSCWELIHNWTDKMQLFYKDNKADLTMTASNKNIIHFDGLDNVYKKRSIEGINYIWIEEAAALGYEATITEKELIQLDMLCRAQNPNGVNQIFISFNPVDPVGNEWLKIRLENAINGLDGNAAALHINYDENPFLSDEDAARIAALVEQDEEYDKIYRQGIWATPTNLIYDNWRIVESLPERYDERIWGLDFGYSSNPAALVEILVSGDKIYEIERIYQAGLTNPELIDMLNRIIGNKNEPLIADSAEPKSIQEIRNAGFNIYASHKGPDSVRHGINTVKSKNIYILADSVSLVKEKQGYKWKQNASGQILTEPLKFNDHLMDAERYALSWLYGKVKAGIVIAGKEEIQHGDNVITKDDVTVDMMDEIFDEDNVVWSDI